MPNPKVALLVGIAGTLLVLPGAASAQIDPGVNYDPGSPAGKEYAIPLVEGRSDAAGTTNQRSGGNIPFGVGIKPPSGGSGKRGGNGGGPGAGAGAGARGNDGRKDSVAGERPGETPEQLNARISAAEQSPGSASLTLLLVLAVLLPAGLLTLLLRPRGQVSRTGTAA
jgi:hypothetical protein